MAEELRAQMPVTSIPDAAIRRVTEGPSEEVRRLRGEVRDLQLEVGGLREEMVAALERNRSVQPGRVT